MLNNPIPTRSKLLIELVLLILFVGAAIAQTPCGSLGDVLRFGADETEISRSLEEARRAYRFACRQESSSSSRRNTSSGEAGWGGYSIGARNDTQAVSEYRSTYCSQNEDDVARQAAENFRRRRVNPEAVAAWSRCIEQQGGISLVPRLDSDQTVASFSITYDSNRLSSPPILRGINSITFKCETAGGGMEISVGGDPIEISSTDQLNIVCNRKSVREVCGDSAPEELAEWCERHSEGAEINGRRVTVYPRDTLILDLTRTGHRIDFAKKRVGPAVEEFAELQQRIRRLEALSERTGQRLETLMGRQWHNVIELREEDRCYMNNTEYPMEIAISTDNDGGRGFCRLEIVVEGRRLLDGLSYSSGSSRRCISTATIPPGAEYRIKADTAVRQGKVLHWWELKASDDDVQQVECR